MQTNTVGQQSTQEYYSSIIKVILYFNNLENIKEIKITLHHSSHRFKIKSPTSCYISSFVCLLYILHIYKCTHVCMYTLKMNMVLSKLFCNFSFFRKNFSEHEYYFSILRQ